MIDRPLDIHEAAAWLGCHVETLARLARSGDIPCRKVGGWKFMHQDLLDYVRHNKKSEEVCLTASTGSKTARSGTLISGLTKPGDLEKALAAPIKNKRRNTQNIVGYRNWN